MKRRLVQSPRSFCRDTHAATAILTGLMLVPMLGLIGLAIDFGFVTQTRTALDMAADTAALSAVKVAANAASAGNPLAIALGEQAGAQWYLAQAQTLAHVTPKPATVQVNQNGTVFTATVTYQASNQLIGPMQSIQNATVGNTAGSTMTSNTYLDVTFLLDNSGSMLLAATQAGIDQLNPLTQAFTGPVPDGLQGYKCAFACHWQTDPSKTDYYSIAQSHNILLRTQVLKQAFQAAVQTMQNDAIVPNQFGIGVFTFDSALEQIYPPSGGPTTTTNIAPANAAVQNIPVPCCQDVANTNFPAIMASLAQIEPASGDGTTPLTPKKSLIIVTDGMADYGPRSTPTSEGPFNPANCNAIKALGYSVYVLYTNYSSDPSALLFNGKLLPYLSGSPSPMEVNLQNCASSPGNFAAAADPATIISALNTILLAAIGSAGRFTQ